MTKIGRKVRRALPVIESFRIFFENGVPKYPDVFEWLPGATYAHMWAGGGFDEGDYFRSEAEFLADVAADPPGKGMCRIIALVKVPDRKDLLQ